MRGHSFKLRLATVDLQLDSSRSGCRHLRWRLYSLWVETGVPLSEVEFLTTHQRALAECGSAVWVRLWVGRRHPQLASPDNSVWRRWTPPRTGHPSGDRKWVGKGVGPPSSRVLLTEVLNSTSGW
jgi:hypothetical protein